MSTRKPPPGPYNAGPENEAGGPDGWQPTAENINVLPEALRQYVVDLETRCDPAGEVRELAIARDIIRSLRERIAELEAERDEAVQLRRADRRALQLTKDRLQERLQRVEAERDRLRR